MEEYQEVLDHFPRDISSQIRQYADEIVLRASRYIFTRRKGKRQYGYCTHCGAEFETTRPCLKHNNHENCPECNSYCIVKASGMGRQSMLDDAYFVYYEKSLIDSQAIVARGIYAVRDYRCNYHNVETNYLVKANYVFAPGESVMIKRYGRYGWDGMMVSPYEKAKSIHSLFAPHLSNGWGGVKKTEVACLKDSIEKAITGTSFQYSQWEEFFPDEDMVKFFGIFAKYPGIEHLIKQGF